MRVRSLAKAVLTEMALDLGGAPGFEPGKQRKIERGQHPYSNNPAFPREPGAGSYPPNPEHPQPGRINNYAELAASDQYKQIADKVSRALGIPINQVSPQNGMRIGGAMMQAFTQAVRFEAQHKPQLEQMAVNLVLDLPEFEGVRQVVNADQLRIKAKLVDQVTPGDMQAEPPEPDEAQQAELEVAEIAAEMDVEKEKRRFVNLLTQGAAINKNHAYHLVADRLNAINPRLLSTYAILMSVGDWMYWVMPDEALEGMMGEGENAAGKARFYIDEDGVAVIDAEAKVFPVLIQEVVKGMWEFVAWRARSEEGMDPDTEKHVISQVDTLPNETWDIMMGAPIWRQILRMIGPENQKYTRFVYAELVRLPHGEWQRIMNAILKGEPEGQEFIQNLIRDIKAEKEGEVETPGYEDGQPPEEPGAQEDDWWKKESASVQVVNRLLG